MRITLIAVIVIVLLPGAIYAQDAPEIRVSEGKVSISAQAVPLSRLLSLLDRAVGMNSQVKPEVANQPVSVRFTNLELKDAVRKIFEGQPLNYYFIEGKGIRVTERASTSGSTSVASTSTPQTTFIDNPINTPAIPIGNPQPAQPAGGQPAQPNLPFGNQQPPAASAPATSNPGTIVPGQLPPPINMSNPLVTPTTNNAAQPTTNTGFPATPAPTPQPSGPGAVGVTPGQVR
jgi:hypothetical protein